MNLLKLINEQLDLLKTEDAAMKFFDCTANKLGKVRAGNAEMPLSWGQKVLDKAILDKRIMFVAPGAGNSPAPASVSQEAPEPPKQAATPHGAPPQADKAVTPTPAAPAPDPEGPKAELRASFNTILSRGVELDPDEQIEIIEALSTSMKRGTHLLIPTYLGQDVAPVINLSILANTRGLRCAGLKIERRDNIDDARNVLLDEFLKVEGSEWAVLLDPDICAPFGNAEWFRAKTGIGFASEFAGLRTVERLTRHNDKFIIGGTYRVNSSKSPLAMQPALNKRDAEDEALCTVLDEKGPQNKLIEVTWLAPGLMAVHRRVLEAIKKSIAPSNETGPYQFFKTVNGDSFGSGKHFATLATRSGYKLFLDCAVRAARSHRTLAS